jgi:hypothetical protein
MSALGSGLFAFRQDHHAGAARPEALDAVEEIHLARGDLRFRIGAMASRMLLLEDNVDGAGSACGLRGFRELQ